MSGEERRTVHLANPRGFCAGVDRAIEIVERALEVHGAPVYVLHEIVHNRHVLDDLRRRGVVFVDSLDEVPEGAVTIFSAHGVSDDVVDSGRARRLRVIDATCPLVTKVHLQAQRYAAEGRELVLIGHDGHPEVEGTRGRIEVPVHVLSTAEDVERLEVADPERLAYVTQTTLSIDDTRDVIDALERRFPHIKGPELSDICYATQNRQNAVRRMAGEIDVLIVVGSRNSSNSNRLKELGERSRVPSWLVDDPAEIRPEWIAGARTIGVTAGASAPETLVQLVLAHLRELGVADVVETEGEVETTVFKLPESLSGSTPVNPRWTERFVDFGARVWLDTAHTGPLPRASLEAGREALARKHEPWRMRDEDYFALPARVRSLAGRLFGCAPEQVALTNGAGAGTNAVARGIHWEPHDRVVLPPGEFPSNLFPWLWLEQRGVEIVEPAPDDASGAVSAEALAEAIDERTKVVAFSLVSYRHAGRLDPAPIVEAAHAHGSLVVIDASQAAGAEPLELDALGADVVVSAGYKFLLGPYGVGLAAFSERALSEIAVGDLNWWSVEGAADFNKLPGRGFRLVPGAMRWDAHETAAFVQLSTFAESLALVLEADPARTRPHCRALCDALLEGLPDGYHAASPLDEERRSHMLAIRAADPEATAAAHADLAEAGVFVSQRADRLRVAPHFFNDAADVERLLEALPPPGR